MNKSSPKKILIVEDELPLLDSLKDEFESQGFKVLTAQDGQEGLETVERERPDLVLIDILLPKLDGISMAREINKLNFGTAMIFLTNLSDAEHISDAVAVGMVDYLVKSDWNINDVVKRAKEKLGLK